MLCSFCNLDKSRIILANDHAIAIYDGFSISPGHSLVAPRRHISSFFEATKEEQAAMLELLDKLRQLLLKDLIIDGFNIGINDGIAAGHDTHDRQGAGEGQETLGDLVVIPGVHRLYGIVNTCAHVDHREPYFRLDFPGLPSHFAGRGRNRCRGCP